MNKFLLSGLVAASIAATAGAELSMATPEIQHINHSNEGAQRPAHKVLPRAEAKNVTKISRAAVAKAEAKDGFIYFESFEDWDGTDENWLPEGWTAIRKNTPDSHQTWVPAFKYGSGYPAPADGKNYFMIFYGEEQDEWLISPEIQLEDGVSLTYWSYQQPFYFFSDENIDWETYEYIGDKIIVSDLQVWIQPENEDWTLVKDYAEDFKEYDAYDLMMATPENLEKQSISLARFGNKKIKVAFRYFGSDGDSVFLDAVGVGLPTLDNVSYMSPFATLYWGLNPQYAGATTDIAYFPVNTPITWSNYSDDEAVFSWTYEDPETGDDATSDDQYELTVSYSPVYTEDVWSQSNNSHKSPVLTATAPGVAATSYTAPYPLFMTGGNLSIKNDNETIENFSLYQFGINESGLSMVTVYDDNIGDPSIPVFGHSVNTNLYWLNYSLNGEDAMPSDYNHLEGIANLFIPDIDAPLVVNGADVFGYGMINTAAELTMTIYALNEEMSADPSTFTVVAKATITGADVVRQDEYSKDYLALPFKFETPAVIEATEEHPAYFFMLEGFNSDEVPYFAPLQSAKPLQANFAYIKSHVDLSAQTGRPAYYSVKPIVYKEDGDYVDPIAAFAIGLVAEYPWLTTNATEVEMTGEEKTVAVELDSYYTGDKYTVETPEGLTATVEGRYNKANLIISRAEGSVAAIEGTVVVSAPGVKLELPVKAAEYKSGAISSALIDSASEQAIYDVYGRKVENPAGGIYIIKNASGNASKRFIQK